MPSVRVTASQTPRRQRRTVRDLCRDRIGDLATVTGQLRSRAQARPNAIPPLTGQAVEERGVIDAALGLSDPDFAPCREHPLLAEAAAAMLGPDWHLGGLELRAPLPGCGHQGLHPDYFPGHRTHGPWRSLSAMWCISAFTAENGPLRVIPGSHRVARSPVDDLAYGSETGPHPAEVKVIAPAGSVVLFNNADLWHSGTFNYSPAPRLAVTAALLRGRAPVDEASPAGSALTARSPVATWHRRTRGTSTGSCGTTAR